MPSNRVLSLRQPVDSLAASELREGIERIRTELGVTPDFPPEVEEAARAAAAAPRLPALDRTDLPLLTIDPPGARDLDQALHLAREGDGYLVHYAIADVAAFVTPGDPVDVEANLRGETLYGADSKIPLHPKAISEEAGSLLPGQDRPALLWRIVLDASGEGTEVQVERAMVRSRAQLDYAQAQRLVDDRDAGPDALGDVADAAAVLESLRLLSEVGPKRLAREAARGGVSLPLPEQQIDTTGDQWRLEFRTLLAVEEWNAQLSLLTGMAAASLMVYARVGLLRTLPPPQARDLERLRRTARGLGVDWPAEMTYPDLVRTLDPSDPRHAAMVVACTRLLRGSGYVAFDGELPEQAEHAAIASEYAHVTAPLRRLVDRYASEVCVALCAGEDVPGWVLERLHALPATMRESGRRAGQYERAVLDLMEAEVLKGRVGESFDAVVVEVDEKDPRRGDVNLLDLAIDARVTAERDLPLGERISVVLTVADPLARKVEFRLA